MADERGMEDAEPGASRRLRPADVVLVVVVVLLVAAAVAGMALAYVYYRDTLRQAQEANLTTTAETASGNLAAYFDLRARELDLQFAEDLVARVGATEDQDAPAGVDVLLASLDVRDPAVLGVSFVPRAAALRGDAGVARADNGLVGEVGSWEGFLAALDQQGRTRVAGWYRAGGAHPAEDDGYVMELWRPVRMTGVTLGYVVETIDLDAVYEELLGPIQVGERGYCTFKDPGRVIVMHRVRNQIGSQTRQDRVEGHPEGDWGELDSLQYSGEPGCSITTSYWWDDLDAGLVKKFIGYAPTYVDGNFFVTNVVMAYDELMSPLQTMWALCVALGAVVLGVMAFGGWRLAKSIQDARHLQRELAIEQELLAQTQRVKLQERQIQHIDRVQTLGLVTSSVAHEMKNHLTPLAIYGQMLQDPDLPEDDRVEAAREVEKLSARCAQMLEHMLSYARRRDHADPAGGSGAEAAASFDASAAVSEALAMVRPLCPRDVSLVADVCDRPCTLPGEAASIEQVVLNLATNALYAMRGGGGELGVSWGPDGLRAGMWTLVVSDTGCGMDEATRRLLFSTFFTTKGEEGTGLGMSVVQSHVQAMHASIEVVSAPGEGTTFTLRFPAADS